MARDRFDMMMPRVGPAPGTARRGPERKEGTGDGDFARALEEARSRNEAVRFSAHALDRIESRGLALAADELKALAGAVDQLAAKGGKQSLVLTPKAALVVSVDNRMVITAVDRASEAGRVFTDIDSAVVL